MKYKKINKITKTEKKCYDITVSNNHNFFCNKHLIHNSGYRGEVKVVLFNTSEDAFKIKNGDRIAQGVIAPVQTKRTTKIITVNQLDDSDRGTGGFGSTGV
jgi:deoxyuridine 5'-triphosphate nucleotidohydrolase